MGGSSGAMYSLLFEAAAVYIENCGTITAKNIAKAFTIGLEAMKKYGGAREGDRTMIDALSPALDTFQTSLDKMDTLKALEVATCASEEGANKTLKMKAYAGRASYVPDSELKHPDPGAHAIGITMRSIFNSFIL